MSGVNWTQEDLDRLNATRAAHGHAAIKAQACGCPGNGHVSGCAVFGAKKAKKMASPPRRANKWENEFAARLQSQVNAGYLLWFQFEAMRFRLAGGAYYKPDFVAMLHTGELIAYEVKGFWREAARVRIKVAADRHPIRFVAVRKQLVSEGGGWDEEMFMDCERRTRTVA